MTEQRDAVVIGGGVSGLAAGFHLARAGVAVTLLEASERLGGLLETRREGEWVVELGPNTVAERRPLAELIEQAGLGAERLHASPAASRRYLWRRGALHPLPQSPPQILTSPLLSWRGKAKLAREPWAPAAAAGREESVAEFVRRRFGAEALEVFAAPFVAGIFAGDPERLSMRWTLPRVLAFEHGHGSVLRALRAARRAGATGLRQPVVSFRGGLSTLTERLAAAIPDVRRGARVDAVRRDGDGFVVESTAGALAAKHVVVAVPAPQTACLLFPASDGRSAGLAELPYAPVAVVALGYPRADVAHPLDGFGFLAAPGSGLRLLGCLFSSTLFADRAPAAHVLLTCFLGGRTAPELAELDDAELVRIAADDVTLTLGARAEPVFTAVRKTRRAIPQYELGHQRFVDLAADLARLLPGLHLAGNWLRGAGVADCVERAAAIATQICRS
ncbi:MAG TPA: protoporphyrinogen oxidase [Thermoanaerobaculia bacterium]|jgi:oxygen-dependent protoporphyrinogen oxidase|nr:protoporphyrinogen oxidase [Thermoanaerobaculia bacterium]